MSEIPFPRGVEKCARVFEMEDGTYRVMRVVPKYQPGGKGVFGDDSVIESEGFKTAREALEHCRSVGADSAVLRFYPQEETLPLVAQLCDDNWYFYNVQED